MTDEETEAPVYWPDGSRPLFGPGDPWELNARIRWIRSPGGLLILSQGYREAAEWLFEDVRRERRSPDFAVYPIAFLWRHHIELTLKNIIANGKRLHNEKPEFDAVHGLLGLWKDAKPYVEESGPPDAPEMAI